MAQFEYDLSDKDYTLVASEIDTSLGNNDYVRIIVHEQLPNNGLRILTFSQFEGEPTQQAIFYSSLSEIPFEINTSPFGGKLNETLSKTVGEDFNDFKIYQNPNGAIYLKPNELFDTFNLPESNYKIQIDFLNQLNEVVNIRFENFRINNRLTKNGHNTLNGDIYPSGIDYPIFTTDSSDIPQISRNEQGENTSPLPNDNLIYWSDDTIPIEDIRGYFSPAVIRTDDEHLSTLPQPEFLEELDYNGNDIINVADNIGWGNENRTDLVSLITQIANDEVPPLPRAFNGYSLLNNASVIITWQHEDFPMSVGTDNAGFPDPNPDIPAAVVTIIDDETGENLGGNDFLIAGRQYRITANFETENFSWFPQVPLSPNNTLGVRPLETFYNNTPVRAHLPIRQVSGVGGVSIYQANQSENQGDGEMGGGGSSDEFSWQGSLTSLEKGKYYTILLETSVEDDYEIDINRLTGPHLFTPQNDYLLDDFYKFIIREISTSRKEVRLKLIDKNINSNTIDGKEIISQITSELNKDKDGNQTNKYQFNHKLNFGDSTHIQIMNYSFDSITDGRNNQSIILRLYKPLPTNINKLSQVTIENEKIITQFEDIVYFSDDIPALDGDGLTPSTSENWINYQGEETLFQTQNNLSASIQDYVLDGLVSQSKYNYPNLNTDFRYFQNHTFFGSAKKKLENFKTKVETIQVHYTNISSSLFAKGVDIESDSTEVIENRKNLFNKINREINSFTPYERFLYFDGQYESTASAPGLGKNYADTLPVTLHGGVGSPVEGIEIPRHNGFDVVYKHSSEKVSGTHNQYIDLFTDKYKVENKPFFNYDDSIYLSFLLQGDSGSALTWENRNKSLNPPLPHDTLYQKNILNPDMTSSAHQRYIFEASMSYFVPNTTNNDMNELSKEAGDFNNNSSKITILSGSVKTGSQQMRDTLNSYPTTVISQSGVPFFGSVMPSGELFRIFFKNSLSSSLQGYWNIDDVISGSGLVDSDVTNDAGPTFGDGEVNKQVSASSGVEVHGRQYGSSYFMISESSSDTGVHFDSLNYNYNKEDNFSMAIWVKRSHPTATNADPVAGTRQGVFTRGHTTDSYGIDYNFANNVIRVGVRPAGSEIMASASMSDDLLNWHHIAFTYESGSSTGIKLYIDGVLESTNTNIGMGDFSASSANASNNTKLTIGGNDVIGGSAQQFSGFLQYPRIYNRTITAEEVNQLYLTPDGITDTKITDVNITLNNPLNVLPFDNIYKTTSTEWTSWYNGMIDSASAFDSENIHSLQNNLPLYLQEGSDHEEMRTFLSLQGEQYDVIKNHIDSMGTLNDRGYNKTNSPPSNTYPMLLKNMGFNAINPFSGNLTETLGSYLTGVTSIDDIKNNTWRKTLNNLLYIYKTKGTANSVRGLLNTYGYPPDVIKVKQSTNTNFQTSPINNLKPTGDGIDVDLAINSGSIAFSSKQQKLQNYSINGNLDRVLNLDWWTNNASLNTIQFVYKHKSSETRPQTLLISSGSGTQNLWDLRLVPGSTSSSLEFRLNNSNYLTPSGSLTSNAVSMSTSYLGVNDGEIWNIMLQRMTGSSDFTITNEYRLHFALQNNTSIEKYGYTTMSLNGGGSNSSSFYANANWESTGSRNYLDRGNLFVGIGTSGSMSEIKGWSTALSTSRFRQHTLNKFSSIGNSIDSHDKQMTYHFKLNENYISSSVSASGQVLTIVDSAPKCNLKTNYSIGKSGSLFLDSNTYGFDIVNRVVLGLKDNNSFGENENGILINPQSIILGDLSSEGQSVTNISDEVPGSQPSTELDIFNSPQHTINDFIINRVDNFNFEKYYGNPLYYYSSSYDELDDYRDELFKCNPIEVDTNKYIKSHENIYNTSIIEGLQDTVPANSSLSDENANMGVEIRPTILEKQKYEAKKSSVEINPNTPTGSHLVNINLSETIYDSIKEGTAQSAPSAIGSNEVPYNFEISLGNSYTSSTDYKNPQFLQSDGVVTTIENPYNVSISTAPSYDGSTVVTTKDGTIDYALIANESYTSVHKNWGTTEDDVHFINFASSDSGSQSDYNVGHIDTRFHFYTIGDSEYYSSSLSEVNPPGSGKIAGLKDSDFTDINNFHNQLQINDGPASLVGYQHLNGTGPVSLIGHGLGKQNTFQGKRMGKTRFMRLLQATDELVFPRNHVTQFSYPFKDQMNKGTQNIKPGKLNVAKEDYSAEAFYTVTVTGGEKQIIIGGDTEPSKDSQNRIIY